VGGGLDEGLLKVLVQGSQEALEWARSLNVKLDKVWLSPGHTVGPQLSK
jgi:hypothetical protein